MQSGGKNSKLNHAVLLNRKLYGISNRKPQCPQYQSISNITEYTQKKENKVSKSPHVCMVAPSAPETIFVNTWQCILLEIKKTEMGEKLTDHHMVYVLLYS